MHLVPRSFSFSTVAGTVGIVLGLGLAACNSSGTDSNADLAPAPDLAFLMGPHSAPPQVVDTGGAVLAAPVLVPVFFSNDDATQVGQLADFLSKVGATQYWAAGTAEYGVGAATATPSVMLTETATGTLDDSAIQTWLAGKLNANDPTLPAATTNTIYVINYPAGVTITLGGQQSCQSFGAYHSDLALDVAHQGMYVSYAVIPRCPGSAGLNVMQSATAATSHELMEAATDPYPNHDPAFATVDTDHRYWSRTLGGGEVGDMCAQDRTSYTKFAELDFTVQRSWSNAAALAGHDPCVPALPGKFYFNSVPVFTDVITAGPMGMFMVPGAHVPVGTSKTIDLQLFSDGDVGAPWTVDVADLAQPNPPHYTFALDKTTGQNGDTLHLTITTLVASTRGTATFVITSTLKGTGTHEWFGFIGDKP